MAVDLTVQDQLDLMEAGLGPTFAPASALGHTVDNPRGAESAIWVENQSADAITMTIISARKSNFGTFPNKTLSILPGTLTQLPTFCATRFTDPLTGKMSFSFSAVASVNVAAMRLRQYFQEA